MNGQIYSQTKKKEYVGNFRKLNTQYLPEAPWCFGEILIYRK